MIVFIIIFLYIVRNDENKDGKSLIYNNLVCEYSMK